MLNSQFPAKTIGRKLLHEVATIGTPLRRYWLGIASESATADRMFQAARQEVLFLNLWVAVATSERSILSLNS
jgi:hypothetical protein